jgi:hypothetical protein
MEVIDAEYQWCVLHLLLVYFTYTAPLLLYCRDRRKLTFYFVAEKRIDFRELVRELFRCVLATGGRSGAHRFCERLYKTRIWMASLQGPSYEQ